MARETLKLLGRRGLRRMTSLSKKPAAVTRRPWNRIFASVRDKVWLSLHMESILKQLEGDDVRRICTWKQMVEVRPTCSWHLVNPSGLCTGVGWDEECICTRCVLSVSCKTSEVLKTMPELLYKGTDLSAAEWSWKTMAPALTMAHRGQPWEYSSRLITGGID